MMDGIENLRNSLPPIFPRSEVGRLTGGIIQPGTCANLDSLGRGVGPEGRMRIGKKIVYTREAFIAWLASRVKAPQGKK